MKEENISQNNKEKIIISFLIPRNEEATAHFWQNFMPVERGRILWGERGVGTAISDRLLLTFPVNSDVFSQKGEAPYTNTWVSPSTQTPG